MVDVQTTLVCGKTPNCLVATEFTGALLVDVSLSGVGAGVNSRSFIGVSVGVKVVGVEEGRWVGRGCSGGGVKGGGGGGGVVGVHSI